MKKTWKLDIDCPNCAAKLERALTEVPGVEAVTVNYVQKTVTLTAADDAFAAVTQAVLDKTAEVEPDATIFVDGTPDEHEHKHEHEHDHGHDHDHGHGHEHGHDHGHEHGESEGPTLLYRVAAAVALLIIGLLLGDGIPRAALMLAAYLIAGYDVLLRALRNIRRGQIFDENFLMAVASLGSMLMGDYPEAVAVMALYQVGEYFQDKAVDRSRESITQLMDIRPDYANLLDGGEAQRVSPEAVHVGDLILVKPGEKIPLDGEVVEGTSSLNTAALTGESLPRDVKPGDSVLSGCVNISGVLTVRVTAAFGESTVARILTLVEQSGESKAQTERFITRFARVYTPVVCLAAVVLAVIPSLITGQWMTWIHRALTFLVISCPCALIISVPLTFFSGIGGASRQGILVKGANHLETLAALDTVVFDKTGTLTEGEFSLAELRAENGDRDALLEIAALAECYSDHPIAKSLVESWESQHGPLDRSRARDVESLTGRGIRATVDGKTVHAGSDRLMREIGIEAPGCEEPGTIVYIAIDGTYAGYALIADALKPTTAQAISDLKLSGVQRLVMLTGDVQRVAEDIARRIGLTDVRAQLLPADKVNALEGLLGDTHKVAFVGDGINDAPVLRRADLGIAMGGIGSDAAIEAADVVLMDDDPLKLPRAIRLARRTLGIARQNIIFALAVKAVVLILGALGIASMWLAVFADVGVCMIAILNAMRAMKA